MYKIFRKKNLREYFSFSEKLILLTPFIIYTQRESAKAGPEVVHLSILCFILLVPERIIEIPIAAPETK